MQLPGRTTHKFSRWLISAVAAEDEWRKRNNKNFEYYDGDQWTTDEKLSIEERGQQATVLNIIRPTIDTVLALEFEKRFDFQILPREPSDETIADLLTELLKYVSDNCNSGYFEGEAFREALIGGRGAIMVNVYKDEAGKDQIKESWVPWEEIFIDPFHREPDGADARFIFREVWMDRDEVKERFPEKADLVDTSFCNTYQGIEYHAQKDGLSRFDYFDKGSDRIRIFHCWYKDVKGQVKFCSFADDVFFVGGENDSDNADPLGINTFPIVIFPCFRTKKGAPKGIVEYLMDVQDQINKLNSKFLWNVSANRIIGELGAVDGGEDAWDNVREEWSKPDGIVKLADGGLAKIRTEDNLRESAHLSNHLQFLLAMGQRITGVNDSMQGLGGVNERSASQQQTRILRGASVQTRLLLNLEYAKKSVVKKTLLLIGKYFNDERTVRITKPNGMSEYFKLNQPADMDEQGNILLANKIGDTVQYDVVLKPVSPFTTTKELQMQYFTEAAKSGAIPGALAGEIMMELSDLPHKSQYIQRLQQAQQQAQMMAQQQAPQ